MAQHTKSCRKEHRTARSSPQQGKTGHHSATRSTQHGNTAPQNLRQKAATARCHQTAQDTTCTPRGVGGSRRQQPPTNAKQAGRSTTAEEEHGMTSCSTTTPGEHTPRGGGRNRRGIAQGQAENTKAAGTQGQPSNGSRRTTKQTPRREGRGGGGGTRNGKQP